MVAIHFRAGLGRAVVTTVAIAAIGMAIVQDVLPAIIDANQSNSSCRKFRCP